MGRKKHAKNMPLETKKTKTPNPSGGGNSNVLAQGPIIQVFAIVDFSGGVESLDKLENRGYLHGLKTYCIVDGLDCE